MLKNPAHPGEILREEVLPYHGVSPTQAAITMGIEPAQVDLILAGQAPIDHELAERIEAEWGVSAELMVNVQRHFDDAHRRSRRGVPSRATIIVLAVLAFAGIAWQAVGIWRMLT